MAMGPPNFADALLVGHRYTVEPKKLRLVAAAAAADDGYREALQTAVPCHWDLKTPASLQVAAAQVRFIAAAVTLEPSSCTSPLPSLEAEPWVACSRPNDTMSRAQRRGRAAEVEALRGTSKRRS